VLKISRFSFSDNSHDNRVWRQSTHNVDWSTHCRLLRSTGCGFLCFARSKL